MSLIEGRPYIDVYGIYDATDIPNILVCFFRHVLLEIKRVISQSGIAITAYLRDEGY